MRHFILAAAAAVVLAAPAAAQDAILPEEDFVRSLPDQREIDAMGDAMRAMIGAMMDLQVGGIIAAVDPTRPLTREERERTLGDIAGRDDPYVEERLQASTGAITAGIGAMIGQMAVLAPVLAQTMDDVEARIDDATRHLPPPAYDDELDYED